MKYTLTLPGQAPCHYQLQVSVRARYLRIKVSPVGDVRVVVPRHMEHRHAHNFVREKADWIAKKLQKTRQSPVAEIVRPEQLILNMLEECWRINYQPTPYQGLLLTPQRAKQQLVIEGCVEEVPLIYRLLAQWLKEEARGIFPGRLDALSEQFSLPYGKVTVRGQKTLWGSCSSRKNISLNYKLLFFPEPIVRYVLIHELCHTREMNHSARFWNLVAQYDPGYVEHRRLLKQRSGDFVPAGFHL